MNGYFKYRFTEKIDFNVNEGEFITIVGNNNDLFINTLVFGHPKCNVFVGDKELNKKNADIIKRRLSIVMNRHLNIFSSETVEDELAFGLESLAMSKDDMRELIDSQSRRFKIDHLLKKDPCSLGSSDKTKMKILSSLILKPNVLILDNIMSELDYIDKELVFNLLQEFTKKGGIVINCTNDIEESLYAQRIIILYDKALACEGKTLSVLNEEKLLKRLGIGLPFLVELNKYFMDYGMIDKYHLTNEKLVNALWK
ncbi:MAG: hypothetical protein IJ966_04730 [Bacilli bacterium]|nr:hypothetical protein [Bacilli bacterium]